MDKIINYLLLIIIFVFDPLAISLVIAANFAFEQSKPKNNKVLTAFEEFNKYLDEYEPNEFDLTLNNSLEEDNFEPATFEDLHKDDTKNSEVDLAPQQEFDILDINTDGIIDNNEKFIMQNKIDSIENTLQNTSLSGWRSNKLRKEAEDLRRKINKDDNIIDYN